MGPGRAVSGGLAVKKVQPKDPIRPRWGKKTRAYLSPKKRSFVSRGFEKIMKNYEKLRKITKNYGFEHTPKSTLFLGFF